MHIKTYVPSLAELNKLQVKQIVHCVNSKKIIHKQQRSYSMVLLNATYTVCTNRTSTRQTFSKSIIKGFSQSSKNSRDKWG